MTVSLPEILATQQVDNTSERAFFGLKWGKLIKKRKQLDNTLTEPVPLVRTFSLFTKRETSFSPEPL
jgi:hypothetical protein